MRVPVTASPLCKQAVHCCASLGSLARVQGQAFGMQGHLADVCPMLLREHISSWTCKPAGLADKCTDILSCANMVDKLCSLHD